MEIWMWVVLIVFAFTAGMNFGWNARQYAILKMRDKILQEMAAMFEYVRELERTVAQSPTGQSEIERIAKMTFGKNFVDPTEKE